MNRNKKKDENGYPDISGIFDIDESKIPKKPIKPEGRQKEITEPILTASDDIHSLPEEEQKKIKKENKKKEKEKKKNRAKTRLILILIAVLAAISIFALVKYYIGNAKKPVVTIEKPALESITRYYQAKGVTAEYNSGFAAVFADNNYDVHFIEAGMTAEIITDNGTFPGKVSEIKAEEPDSILLIKYYSMLLPSKPQTSVYTVYVTPDSPEVLTEEGKKISVKVITKTVDETLTLPSEALSLNGNQYYVWIYEPAGGKLKKQDVTTGISSDGKTQITAGIKKSDRVVTVISCEKDKIYDGMQVKTD